MQKESVITKIAFFFNKVLALATFLAYILPFLTPKLFPFLSVLTLLMPLFLILNFAFFTVWILQLKRKAVLSGIVLLIGFTFINKFYKFSETDLPESPSDFKLMSYNVRLFNLYEWLPVKDIPEQITDVIQDYNPDILCLQEYSPNSKVRLRNFPYRYVKVYGERNKYGQAIFSKYEIINSGEIDFPNTSNNVIYTDLVRQKDTIRVYSMHLQSIKISTDIHEKFDENKSKFIFKRISQAFSEQQLQAEIIREHFAQCPYSKIICGDMNNSAFSYVYRTIKGEMKDAFEEAGTGFGKSYNFDFYPARIDYVLTDKDFTIKTYRTDTKVKLSDHFPVYTRISLEK
ncbi:endonuclease/exonuclease/phosphatase family protein [Flavobacterium sp. NRK F10]|uniref:Endonuclease n=1 Tax=Flavobacterium sediminis TaxID=2201181 RepID=A0A2U8QWT0_9FLAO|nr:MULTISPECIES: endonuclease/exonuclease/phosphatase family protein [Flavobacterium]AWM14326.1 endonuclease [Flavobacterium sediminis]MCO6175544.1 endonuclease/exonuclease/phosphatase family protein [Flavobacterium sp. NRK F10]